MKPASGVVDYETPQELFDELNKEFRFTLDVCADEHNHKVEYWLDKKIDGLKSNWDRSNYCNPPYGSQIKDWVAKAWDEFMHNPTCDTIVMLLPARTDTKWFHDYIYGKAEVRFIKGRLKFGKEQNSAPFPSMIVIFRNGNRSR